MPNIAASVEFARRPLALPPEQLGFVQLPVHKSYGFELPALPVVADPRRAPRSSPAIEGSRSAGTSTTSTALPIERSEGLVRRLWVLKVWGDVVDDRLGAGPLDPNDVLHERRERDFRPDSIGVLTRPVDLITWEARVRTRFRFLADLDADETRWASCDERHRREVEAELARIREGR